jgi:CheY-like chemotaxis protein
MEIDYTQKLSLLLVDDVAVHRFLMASGIEGINPFITIDQAASLDEAIAKLSTNSYSAVISDWSMPGGSGTDLVRWMRARPQYQCVPFIMVSGKEWDDGVASALREQQVDAYIVKPPAPRDLYEKMMNAMEKRRKSATF